MNKKYQTVTFLVLFSALIIILVAYNFRRYYIAKDYSIYAFTACDPAQHSCFQADPDTADPTFQSGYYAKVEMEAVYAPACLDEHTCENFSCDNIASCKITYCSSDTIEPGETCSSIASPTSL